MEKETLVKIAVAGVIVFIVVPAVTCVMSQAAIGIAKCVDSHNYKKKIKQGLKDGSVVEINGEYYTVEPTEEA